MTKEEYLKKCCEKCSFYTQGCLYVFRGKYCYRIKERGFVWDAAEKAAIEKACKLWHKNVLKAEITEEEFRKMMEESK